MSQKQPRADEQAAADAISAVEDLAADPCYEPNGRDTAPDWRLWMTDGRVVDMEVILCADEDATWFRESLAPKGRARCKSDDRLSHRWTITISDSNPSRKDRPIGKLMKAVHDVLASVEREGGTPSQMRETARSELLLDREVGRHCGDFGHTSVEEPVFVGDGNGLVRTYGVTLDGYYEDLPLLLGPVQERINKKDKKIDKRPLASAADLRWLAVTLEGIPALLLNDLFGPDSPSPRPSLNSLSWDHFNEVWLVAGSCIGKERNEGFVVLRLLKGDVRPQRHVVPPPLTLPQLRSRGESRVKARPGTQGADQEDCCRRDRRHRRQTASRLARRRVVCSPARRNTSSAISPIISNSCASSISPVR